jgi:hypothetical protein
MTRTVTPPPLYDRMIDDEGKPTMAWTLFFNSIYLGDQGTEWTPVATSLGSTGTPTLTGTYYRISSKLVYFNIVVTPATDTTSTAGTTYFTGLPFDISANGFCTAQSLNLGGQTGMVVASNDRIYPPAWTTISVPVTITGVVEVL